MTTNYWNKILDNGKIRELNHKVTGIWHCPKIFDQQSMFQNGTFRSKLDQAISINSVAKKDNHFQ